MSTILRACFSAPFHGALKQALTRLTLALAALFLAAAAGSAQVFVPLHTFISSAGFFAPMTQGPDGALYSVSSVGGLAGYGTVFKVQPEGTGYHILYSFTNGTDGSNPVGGLLLSGNTLYGTAENGGSGAHGTVYKINTDGSGFGVIYSFTPDLEGTNLDGAYPHCGLALAGGTLYGTTAARGGHADAGTVFKVNTDGSGFANLYNFTGPSGGQGAFPIGGLVESGGALYGTAQQGGNGFSGIVFKIDTDGMNFTILHNFTATAPGAGTNADGGDPVATLVLSNGTLYGTASEGGTRGGGTVFTVNTDGSGFTNLYNFTSGIDGANPMAALALSDGMLYGTASSGGSFPGYGTIFALNSDGTGFTNLYFFKGGNDGSAPVAGLILSGSALYGTASAGGDVAGSVFKIGTNGSGFTVLSDGREGTQPLGGLVLSGSTFFGTTSAGGSTGSGTIFEVNTNGTGFATLYTFSAITHDPVSGNYTNNEGAAPIGTLVVSGGALYGTTEKGGSFGVGTVFRISTNGTVFTNLYNFTNGPDGGTPTAGVILSGNTLYGTARNGGINHLGSVFQLNTDGSGFSNVYSFSPLSGAANNDGVDPLGGLTLSGGTLYGTAAGGGPGGGGTLFKVNTDGTGFTNIYSFNQPSGIFQSNAPDGATPTGALTLSGDTLYGTAAAGGRAVSKGTTVGTLFKVTTNGTGFVRLYDFPGGFDGDNPSGTLTLSGGMLYGTTPTGGSGDAGTVFEISTNGTGFTTLHTFAFQGGAPAGDLVLAGDTLYGASQFGGAGYGMVFAVTPSGPPSIQFTAIPTNGPPPLTVQFRAPLVDDKDNTILHYYWDFGDGATSGTQPAPHLYATNGIYTPTLVATNNNGATVLGSGPAIVVAFPSSVQNGGFETGSFTNWTSSGSIARMISAGANYVHSGRYGAQLGETSVLGFLSQTLSTTPGTVYSISFWLDNPNGRTPNEFQVSWNGALLFDQTNIPAMGWTNIQLTVTAAAVNTVLQFGYRNSSTYFGFDDISVTSGASAQPQIAGFSVSGANLVLNGGGASPGRSFFLLMTTNLAEPLNQWTPVATNVPDASGNFSITASNAVTPNVPQGFYILQLQ